MKIEELKQRVDLHGLADRLGVRRKGGIRAGKALYHAPHRTDAKPSLSIFDEGRKWKDFASDQGGSCIDFMMMIEGIDAGAAIARLHEIYGWPLDPPAKEEAPREKTLAEFIADRCLSPAGDGLERAVQYLVDMRKIPRQVAERAVKTRSVGFNDWHSKEKAAGEDGYGGPGVAFIVRSANPGHVVAVDVRYLDPALNGGRKTSSQGEKHGYYWTSDHRALTAAHTVVVVESAINALTVEAAGLSGFAAIATRGVAAVGAIDWRAFRGKRVLVCMDADEANAEGKSPGRSAAWAIHEALIASDVSALLIDQDQWPERKINDLNDLLQADGPEGVAKALRSIEPWLIPGQSGEVEHAFGKPRVWLPSHDFAQYWRFRVREDFTSFVTRMAEDDGQQGELEVGERKPILADLCSFRVAAISRISIASAAATMTGVEDSMPRTLFAVSAQIPRHRALLQRAVFEDHQLHNPEKWKVFGAIWNQGQFLRMINILERAVDIGSREAANFVGLCWRKGQLAVNEGPDCYFADPRQQCAYHGLVFPSGPAWDAKTVINAYAKTFQQSAALLALVWGLGAHLKCVLGFWPHLVMQANKGAGKSTLIKRLEATIAFTMFSGQSLQTEFRLLTSISHTSHPVGWEELSARRQDIIDKAVAILQENYQYTVNRRGTEMTEFLLSAPVLLAGEDVPARSLIGKLVRTDLTRKKGDMLPRDLPRFPVRQWLDWLTKKKPADVQALFDRMQERLMARCAATESDDGARRMVTNYAALATAWQLLTEFANVDGEAFMRDLAAEMNRHVKETTGDRQPWVWILERIFSEIAAGEFRFPFLWETIEETPCLLVRTSHVMDHISRATALREVWNGLPIKSDRVFKRQLADAEAVLVDRDGEPRHYERVIGDDAQSGDPGKRVAYLVAIDLTVCADFGIHPVGRGDVLHRLKPGSVPLAP